LSERSRCARVDSGATVGLESSAVLAEWTELKNAMQASVQVHLLRQGNFVSRLLQRQEGALSRPQEARPIGDGGGGVGVLAGGSPQEAVVTEGRAHSKGGVVLGPPVLSLETAEGPGTDGRKAGARRPGLDRPDEAAAPAPQQQPMVSTPSMRTPEMPLTPRRFERGTSFQSDSTAVWAENYRKLKRQDRRDSKSEWAVTLARDSIGTPGPGFVNSLVTGVLSWMKWWQCLEEPQRTGCSSKIVHHRIFGPAVAAVIFANAIYTLFNINYEMDTLGQDSFDGYSIELTFLIVYIVELMLKLATHRMYFFCNDDMLWNCMDFVLVIFSLGDVILTVFRAGPNNVTFARSLRLFKMGKILRIFKSMRFLRVLRVMMGCIYASFVSLFWSFVLTGMILYVFSLFFVQQMTVTLAETEGVDDALWAMQRESFRSVQRGILTLMQCTMGGLDWDTVYRLIEPMGTMYIMVFIFYIAFFNFAVFNILTGIFVENALKHCRPDGEELLLERRRKKFAELRELERIAEAMDLDGSGNINREEFLAAAQNEELVARFVDVGIDIRNTAQFFDTVGGSVGEEAVPVEDFVQKASHLQGVASNTVLHSMMMHMDTLMRRLDDIQVGQMLLHGIVGDQGSHIGNIETDLGLVKSGSVRVHIKDTL